MSAEKGQPILLAPLRTRGSFVFRLPFPTEIETEDATNYERSDVIRGIKRLSYANEEPQRIELKEVLFDATDNPGGSIRKKLDELRGLMKLSGGRDQTSGTRFNVDPPELIYSCGASRKLVYIERLQVTEKFFTKRNEIQRAIVNISLVEKPQEEIVTVRIPELDDE